VGFHSEAGVGKNLWNLVDNDSTNLGCMEIFLEPWSQGFHHFGTFPSPHPTLIFDDKLVF
jgi:hypothetical protein